jgi:uncharacterized protein (UPF0305 family)
MTNEDIKEKEEEIRKFSKKAEFAKTEGGKELIDALGEDIITAINELRANHKIATHTYLVATIARLNVLLNLYRELKRAETKKKTATKELEEMVKNLLE